MKKQSKFLFIMLIIIMVLNSVSLACIDHVCSISAEGYTRSQGHGGSHDVGRLCETANPSATWHSYTSGYYCWTCEHTANSPNSIGYGWHCKYCTTHENGYEYRTDSGAGKHNYTSACPECGMANTKCSTCEHTMTHEHQDDKTDATAPTLTAYSGQYDGYSHTFTVVSSGSGGTLKYSLDQVSWTTTKPTRTYAGSTTVYAKVFGDDTHNDSTIVTTSIDISKASISPIVYMDDYTYGGTLSSPYVTNNPGNGAVTYYYREYGSSSWYYWSNVSSSTYLEPGTYVITGYVEETTNYQGGYTDTDNFSVTKVGISPVLVMEDYTYGGTKSIPYLSGGNPGGGTVTYYYRSSSSSSWSNWSNVTSSTSLNAGTYYMYAYVYETTNYSSGTSSQVRFDIYKASISPTVSMNDYTYGGTKSTPSVTGNTGSGTVTYYYNTSNSNSGGTNWNTVTSSTSLNAGTYYMYATIGATTNYYGDTTSAVSFTINKADPTITLSMSGYTYGGTKSTPSVTGNSGSGTVTYYYRTTSGTTGGTDWSNVTSSTYLDAGTYYMYAVVDETTNYNSAKSSAVEFTISRANVTPTITMSDYTYGGTKSEPSLTGGNPGNGTVTYYYNTSNSNSGGTNWNTVTSSKSLNVGQYYMYATVGQTTNYNGGTSAAVGFKVNQKPITDSTITVSISPTTYEYNGQARTPSVTVKDNGTALTQNTDFSVAYSNNIDVGTGTVTITGINNYSGTVTKNFTITKATITVTPSNETMMYGQQVPPIELTTTGAVNGEVPCFAGEVATNASSTANVGVYPITVGTLTLEDNPIYASNGDDIIGYSFKASNYNMNFTTGKNVTIVAADISSDGFVSSISPTTYVYDGTERKPTPTIYYMALGSNLRNGDDYTVAYSNNKNVGTGTVTITGKNNYTGSITKTFEITKRLLTITTNNHEKIFGQADPQFTYTWTNNVSSETPKFTGALSREAGEDVGVYHILEGTLQTKTEGSFIKGNYDVEFNLAGYLTIRNEPLENFDITINPTTYVYDGREKKPTVTVSKGSLTLQQDVDYQVTYTNNKNVGTATAYVSGINNYSGTVPKTFTITKRTLTIIPNNITVNYRDDIPQLSKTWTGIADGEEPAFTGNLATTATNRSLPGTYPITQGNLELADNDSIFLKNNYTLSFTSGKNVTIKAVSLTDPTITASLERDTYEYDGTEHKPAVTVKHNSYVMVKGTDYDVSYSNNKNVGTATVTITGKGGYKDTITKTFSITKRTLNVIPNNVSKIYNSPDPEFTYNVSGAATGETPLFNGKLSRVAGENVGSYLITPGNLAMKNNSPFNINNYNLVVLSSGRLTITRRDIVNATINPTSFIFDGTPKIPTVVVKNNKDEILIKGTDYNVVFTDNINVGTAKAIIIGIGNYSGTIELEYEIRLAPIEGSVQIVSENDDINVGDILSASVIVDPIDANLTYQWYTNTSESTNSGIPIVGETGNILVVRDSFIGKYIYVVVNASKENHRSTSFADCTSVTIKENIPPSEPVITAKLNSSTGADYASGTWTNQNVWISVKSEENYLIDRYEYSTVNATTGFTRMNSISDGSANILVSTNSNKVRYYFRAVDSFGNISPVSSIIVAIDKNKPVISGVTLDVTTWTNNPVTATGSATDDMSGISGYFFAQSSESSYIDIDPVLRYSASKVFNDNVNQYYFGVRDLAGNVAYKEFSVTNIDKIKPNLHIETQREESIITLDIRVSDTQSGVKDVKVNGQNVSLSAVGSELKGTFEIRTGGTYDVIVRDNAGNDNSQKIVVYSVTYSGNGVAGAMATQLKLPGETVIIKECEFVSEDYRFRGWNSASDGGGTTYTAGTAYNRDESITLYAQWDKIIYLLDRVILDAYDFVYTGSAITPQEKVYNNVGKLLQEGRDYTIIFENNIEVGIANAIVNGTGERYSGQRLETRFNIIGTDISNANVALNPVIYVYDGYAKKPNVTVTLGNETLLKGRDYIVRYEDNINAGTAKAIITGRGSYYGEKIATFTITKAVRRLYTYDVGMIVGDSFELEYSYEGSIVNDTLVSNNPSVAKIQSTSDGHYITAINEGTTTLNYYVPEDNNFNEASAELQVTVFKNAEEAHPIYGTVFINNDDEYTVTARNLLYIRASCADYMYISTSNQKPSADSSGWVDYSTKMPYEFTNTEGEKTIYVWFKDDNQKISEVASDSIILKRDYMQAANDSVLLDQTEIDKTQPNVKYDEMLPEGITIDVIFKQKDVLKNGTRSGVDSSTIKYGYRNKNAPESEVTWTSSSTISGLPYSQNYIIVTQAYDRAGNGPTISDEFEIVTPAKYDTVITLKDTRVQCDGLIHEIDEAHFALYGNNNPTGKITYTYYTDRECTHMTLPAKNGCINEGGAPSKSGTYYVQVTLTDDPNYHDAISNVGKLQIGWYISKNNGRNLFSYVEETETGSDKYELNVVGYGEMEALKTLKTRSFDESLTYWSEYLTKIIKLNLGDEESDIRTIGAETFSNLTEITEIVIPETVSEIGDYAFRGDHKVTSKITIPGSVDKLGYNPFVGVRNPSFEVLYGNSNYKVIEGSIVTNDEKNLVIYPGGRNSTSYTIPKEIKTIMTSAFEDVDNLTTVIIPNGVQVIQPKAFYDCSNLEQVEVYDLSENDDKTINLASVGDNAFVDIKEGSNIYTFSREIAKIFEAGRDYNSVNTKVHWPPVITLQPTDMNGAPGRTVKFIVDATSGYEEGLNYEWRKQTGSEVDHLNDPKVTGGFGATTKEYTTSVLNLQNDGDKYYCVVWNEPFYHDRGYAYSNTAKITMLDNANYVVERQIREYGTTNSYFFSTLQDAFDFCATGDNIRVLRNISNEEDATLIKGKNITFTNDGKTLNMNGTIRIEKESSIEMIGSGIITKANDYILESSGKLTIDNLDLSFRSVNGFGIRLAEGSELNFVKGTISANKYAINANSATINMTTENAKIIVNSSSSTIGIELNEYSKLNMANGHIEVTSSAGVGADVVGIYNKGRDDINTGKGKLTISNGTIKVVGHGTDNGDAIINSNSADTLITGGTISGTRYGIYNERGNRYGDVEIRSGSISGGLYGIVNNADSAKIKIGVADKNVTDANPRISGGKIALVNASRNNTLEFYDGTFTTSKNGDNSLIIYENIDNSGLLIDSSITDMVYTEEGRKEITTEEGYSIYAREESSNNIATLRLSEKPVPSNVEGQTVEEGEQATFEVTIITPGFPDIYEYEWQVSVDGGVTWSKLTTGVGINTSRYTTPPASKAMDGNLYRCKITNRAGATYTNGARLTVIENSLYKDQKPIVRIIYKDETKEIRYDNPDDSSSDKYVDMQIIIKSFAELNKVAFSYANDKNRNILNVGTIQKASTLNTYSLVEDSMIKVERGESIFEYTYTYHIKAYKNGIMTVVATDSQGRENTDSQTIDAIYDLNINYEKSDLNDANNRLVITFYANKQVRPYRSYIGNTEVDTYKELKSTDGSIYSYRFTYRPTEAVPETKFVFEDEYGNKAFTIVEPITRIAYRDIKFSKNEAKSIDDMNIIDAYNVAQDLEVETEVNDNLDIQSRYGISKVQADMFMARPRDIGAVDILSSATSSKSYDGAYVKEIDSTQSYDAAYGVGSSTRNNYTAAVAGTSNELSQEKSNYVDTITNTDGYIGADISGFVVDDTQPYMYINSSGRAVNIKDNIYDASFRAVIVGN